jgi:imidazolonepropionase
MIAADLAVIHAGELVCVRASAPAAGPRRGPDLAALGLISDGALASQGGRIVWIGSTDQLASRVRLTETAETIDAAGQVVTPGLVDAHAHPVFAATRPGEFAMRAAGKSYQEIARAGGGIISSVKHTRAASEAELRAAARNVADRMIAMGTTTAEAKSGYGLDRENELKMLRVIGAINAGHAIDWVPTALPGHSVPPEFEGDPDSYVAVVVDEILPAIAKEGLAEFSDVFLEDGVFNRAQALHIQERARALGFGLKFHVDQLSPQGGTELAVSMGAVSADHLEFVSDAGIAALAHSGTVGVLLPGTAYFLDQADRPPVRRLIEAGAAVAVATDVNPGSNMSESMPMALNQACVLYKMSPAEALVAGTLNAAWAIGRAETIGSLEVGKRCDLVIWNTRDYRELAYHYGVNLAATVVKNGKRVV